MSTLSQIRKRKGRGRGRGGTAEAEADDNFLDNKLPTACGKAVDHAVRRHCSNPVSTMPFDLRVATAFLFKKLVSIKFISNAAPI